MDSACEEGSFAGSRARHHATRRWIREYEPAGSRRAAQEVMKHTLIVSLHGPEHSKHSRREFGLGWESESRVFGYTRYCYLSDMAGVLVFFFPLPCDTRSFCLFHLMFSFLLPGLCSCTRITHTRPIGLWTGGWNNMSSSNTTMNVSPMYSCC